MLKIIAATTPKIHEGRFLLILLGKVMEQTQKRKNTPFGEWAN